VHCTFILSHPAVPENIGAAARALVTCGFTDLVLINPQGHEDIRARWLAVGAKDVLEGARIVSSLEEAIIGADLVIGTTARHRRFPRPILDSRELASFIKEKNDPDIRIAIVFGSEQNGLSNEELALCQIGTSVAIAAPYPSLNLAQAVMVYAYELSRETIEPTIPDGETAPPVGEASMQMFMDHTRAVLAHAGIRPDENAWRRLLEYAAHFNAWEMGAFHTLWGRLLKK
jgi:tRNA/rRNA methyltransferase